MESRVESPAGDEPAPWWKVVVAGLPELVVGLQFLAMAAYSRSFLGADKRMLTQLMQAEFLVLHSMAFLGFIGLWKPVEPKARKTRAIAFWSFFALYCAMASAQGWQFFLIFFGLTFTTYLGLFMSWRTASAMAQLGARWVVGFIVFLVSVGVLGTPNDVGKWIGESSVVRAGALYFLALAAVEFSGLYLRAIPRRMAAIQGWIRTAAKK